MIAADRSQYLQFVLADPRHCGKNSFYTATDGLLTLEAEVVKQEEPQAEPNERTHKQQIERLPVLKMLRKYGLGEQREHLLLAGKPGSGKSTTLHMLPKPPSNSSPQPLALADLAVLQTQKLPNIIWKKVFGLKQLSLQKC